MTGPVRRLLPVLPLPLLMLVALALSGCAKAPEQHSEWVIRSRLVFLSEDFAAERAPPPVAQFRLAFPYIAGDIYGAPTTGDYINAVVGADYGFQIDLNRSHAGLLASLEPTEFSLSYLHIEPANARVARLAPMVLQADGIDQLGRTNWFDPDSKRTLMLLYLDRAATISGTGRAFGRPLRYQIQTSAPGYVWVAQQAGADESVYTVIPQPARVLLAVTPVASDVSTAGASAPTGVVSPGAVSAPVSVPQRVASPTRTDTPAR